MGLEAGFAQLVRKGSERLAGTAMAYVVPVSQPACASGLGGFGFCPLGGGLGGGGHSPGYTMTGSAVQQRFVSARYQSDSRN